MHLGQVPRRAPTPTAAARHIIAELERPRQARTVARQLMQKVQVTQRPTALMVAARHITREEAPSLRIPTARQRMVTLTTMAAHTARRIIRPSLRFLTTGRTIRLSS